jgi:uncharacterized membrane protein required for colicin V production
MHALDVLVIVIGAVFVFTGIKRGLIGEVIRLSAMVGGCLIAFMYYSDLGTHGPLHYLPVQPQIRNGIAFILIYTGCALGIIGLGWFIKKAVHLTPLGWIDRLVGALIGILKTLLIAYIACLSIASLPVRKIRKDFNNSIIFKTYQALPKEMTLKSLLKKKSNLRNIFKKAPAEPIDTVQKKFESFKATVDSAKEAQSSTKKDE